MKSFLLLSVFLLVINVTYTFSQEKGEISNAEKSVQPVIKSGTLKYAPEMPVTGSYKVVKNSTGQELDSAVLMQVNRHRKIEDYLWKVNDDVEILIYSINRLK